MSDRREPVSVCKTCQRPFRRTLRQNAFLHAEPFPKLAQQWGESIERTKLICMGKFWGFEPAIVNGEHILLPVKAHTSDMTVAETNTFIDWLVPWAMEEHGVAIMLPDEWRAGYGATLGDSRGYCLDCGKRLTRCGVAISGEFTCASCGTVNVYENSQQPVRRG